MKGSVLLASLSIIALTVSGCATTSAVVPIGQGVYEIAGSSATAFSSGGAQRVRLIQAANKYCAKQGKSATVVDSTATNGKVGSYANIQGSSYGYGHGYNKSSSLNGMAVQAGRKATADVRFRCE